MYTKTLLETKKGNIRVIVIPIVIDRLKPLQKVYLRELKTCK